MLNTYIELNSFLWDCLIGNEVLHIADDVGIVMSKTIGNECFIYSKLDIDTNAMVYCCDTNELSMAIATEIETHNIVRNDFSLVGCIYEKGCY